MKRSFVGMMALVLLASVFIAASAAADDLEQGRQLAHAGQIAAAAEFFNAYVAAHPNDKLTPEALAWSGRILDAMADYLTGEAEKRCYWTKGGARTPECMQNEAQTLNAKYGNGAFAYEHAVLFIFYTGSHYRQILAQFPKSDFVPEAQFYLLLRDLGGHPDIVLPKIKAFLAKYPKGEWHRRGLLLWARVNQDIWYVHRNWSWVLFNEQVDQAELMVRAEPYRQEALRTFQQLMKEKGTFEGQAAAREYALLTANQDDGVLYSIVNDSSPGVLAVWGVDAPPQVQSQTRSRAMGGTGSAPAAMAQPSAPANAPPAAAPQKAPAKVKSNAMPPPVAPQAPAPSSGAPKTTPKAAPKAAPAPTTSPAPSQAPAPTTTTPQRWN